VIENVWQKVNPNSVSKKTKKEKPKSKPVFHKKSDAGKGDVPRQGITQDEWGKKWEKIFGKKEKKK